MATINSRYIQTNLAIRYLKVYLEKYSSAKCFIKEWTIKQNILEMLADIYEFAPDYLLLSAYIWNIELILKLVQEVKKILPKVRIILGGPEAIPSVGVDDIVEGEGETAVLSLLTGQNLGKLKELDDIPFPYTGEDIYASNKILYYESSRGCPFGCNYCLSSLDKTVRYFSLERVKKDLQYFLDQKVRIVKFIDRTFNLDPERTLEIWKYILENWNSKTIFHFEISGELLTKAQLEFLAKIPAGLFQFEIGIQTANPQVLKNINRPIALTKLAENIKALSRNIHVHLDLIAGLPGEDMNSFKHSFDFAISFKPNVLQLGFLKILKGTGMEAFAKENNYKYLASPPYEVLVTPWLKYEEMQKLRQMSKVLDIYYNSGNLAEELTKLKFNFDFLKLFTEFLLTKGYLQDPQKLGKYAEYLREYANL